MSQPRFEKVTLTYLEKQGFEAYCPLTRREKLVKQKTVVEVAPLFPRYVFVKVPEIRWHSLKTTRGVSRVVFSGDKPAKISDKVIDDLKTHEIWLQEPEKKEATYIAGQPVKVISGAFLGHLGIFEYSTPNERECVLLKLLGREARVYISTHDLVAC